LENTRIAYIFHSEDFRAKFLDYKKAEKFFWSY